MKKSDRVGGAMPLMQMHRFTITQPGADAVAITPGMIPGLTLPPDLFQQPKGGGPDPRLEFTEQVLTPDGLTRSLPLDPVQQQEFQKFIGSMLGSDNEAIFKMAVMQFLFTKPYEPELRRALLQRAVSYYKGKGVAQGNGARIQARARGLRTGAAMSTGMEKAGAGPFIGPRGGKWANAEHTIPWHETTAAAPVQHTIPADASPAQPKPAEQNRPIPKRKWVSSVTEAGLPADTQKAFQKDGQYTPERKQLHEKVYSQFLDHVKSVPEHMQPVAIVMMGGSGSGKGTILKHVMGEHGDFVNVNPDDCKEALPEYKKAINLNGVPKDAPPGTERVSARDAALSVHEESSDMAEEIRKRALGQRKNIILDGTGKNAEKYGKKIEELKAAGYHVRLLMPHIDMDEARTRVKDRADRSGRYVPDAFVEEAHHIIPGNFEKIAKYAHEAVLFDNTKPPPRPVWSIDSFTGKHDVKDAKFVEEFKKVSNERHSIAREKGWMKSFVRVLASLRKAEGEEAKPLSLTLDDMLERMQTNQGEAFDTSTGIEDDADDFRAALKGDDVQKGAHGGSYFRRTPKDGGGHRYFYDEEAYNARSDAHVSGADAMKARCRKAVQEHMAAGKDTAALSARFDPKLIAEIVRELSAADVDDELEKRVGPPKMVTAPGAAPLPPKPPQVQAQQASARHTALKEAGMLNKSGGEGSKGGHVIGHTAGGKPIYESKGPGSTSGTREGVHPLTFDTHNHRDMASAARQQHPDFSQKDHADAAAHLKGKSTEALSTSEGQKPTPEQFKTSQQLRVQAVAHEEAAKVPQFKSPSTGPHHEVKIASTNRSNGGVKNGVKQGTITEWSIHDPSKPGGQEFHKYTTQAHTPAERKAKALKMHQDRHGIDKPVRALAKSGVDDDGDDMHKSDGGLGDWLGKSAADIDPDEKDAEQEAELDGDPDETDMEKGPSLAAAAAGKPPEARATMNKGFPFQKKDDENEGGPQTGKPAAGKPPFPPKKPKPGQQAAPGQQPPPAEHDPNAAAAPPPPSPDGAPSPEDTKASGEVPRPGALSAKPPVSPGQSPPPPNGQTPGQPPVNGQPPQPPQQGAKPGQPPPPGAMQQGQAQANPDAQALQMSDEAAAKGHAAKQFPMDTEDAAGAAAAHQQAADAHNKAAKGLAHGAGKDQPHRKAKIDQHQADADFHSRIASAFLTKHAAKKPPPQMAKSEVGMDKGLGSWLQKASGSIPGAQDVPGGKDPASDLPNGDPTMVEGKDVNGDLSDAGKEGGDIGQGEGGSASSGSAAQGGKEGIPGADDEGKTESLSPDDGPFGKLPEGDPGMVEQDAGLGGNKDMDVGSMSKGRLDHFTKVPSAQFDVDTNRANALSRERFQKSKDTQAGVGVPQPKEQPMAKGEQPTFRQDGVVGYSNASDLAVERMFKSQAEMDMGGIGNVGMRNDLQKAVQCTCGALRPAYLTSCPSCGVGGAQAAPNMQKGLPSRSPVRLVPARKGDVFLPNGTVKG